MSNNEKPTSIRELGKREINYDRQLKLFGKKHANNLLNFWMLGYQYRKQETGPKLEKINITSFVHLDKLKGKSWDIINISPRLKAEFEHNVMDVQGKIVPYLKHPFGKITFKKIEDEK